MFSLLSCFLSILLIKNSLCFIDRGTFLPNLRSQPIFACIDDKNQQICLGVQCVTAVEKENDRFCVETTNEVLALCGNYNTESEKYHCCSGNFCNSKTVLLSPIANIPCSLQTDTQNSHCSGQVCYKSSKENLIQKDCISTQTAQRFCGGINQCSDDNIHCCCTRPYCNSDQSSPLIQCRDLQTNSTCDGLQCLTVTDASNDQLIDQTCLNSWPDVQRLCNGYLNSATNQGQIYECGYDNFMSEPVHCESTVEGERGCWSAYCYNTSRDGLLIGRSCFDHFTQTLQYCNGTDSCALHEDGVLYCCCTSSHCNDDTFTPPTDQFVTPASIFTTPSDQLITSFSDVESPTTVPTTRPDVFLVVTTSSMSQPLCPQDFDSNTQTCTGVQCLLIITHDGSTRKSCLQTYEDVEWFCGGSNQCNVPKRTVALVKHDLSHAYNAKTWCCCSSTQNCELLKQMALGNDGI